MDTRKISTLLTDCVLKENTQQASAVDESKGAEQDIATSIQHDSIKVISKLGEGTAAIVMKCQYGDQVVAMKQLNKKSTSWEIAAFKRESEYLTLLQPSPYIVKVLAYDCTHLVMECLSSSLFDIMKQKKKLSWPTCYKIFKCVAKGIDITHREDIVHLDIKPGNIVLTENDEAKLIDFGLAKRLSAGSTELIFNQLQGTYFYMPPEMWQNFKASKKSDIYSFGFTMWSSLTCLIPFWDKATRQELKDAVLKKEREKIPADCPKELADLISDCWQHDPDKRPTADQCEKRLDEMYKKSISADELEKAARMRM